MKRGLAALGVTALLGTSCGNLNSLNSFSSDAEVYDRSISAEFAAARQFMASKCASCHQQFSSYSEAEWSASGLVSPGNPAGSELYLRLKSNGIPSSDQNMPPNGNLSASEAQIIQDWIETL